MNDLRKSTIVLKRGSAIAYVNNNLVFSNANRFSKPISHERPNSGIAGGFGLLLDGGGVGDDDAGVDSLGLECSCLLVLALVPGLLLDDASVCTAVELPFTCFDADGVCIPVLAAPSPALGGALLDETFFMLASPACPAPEAGDEVDDPAEAANAVAAAAAAFASISCFLR